MSIEEEVVGTKICLNNVLQDYTFASDDTPRNKGHDFLHMGPFRLYQAQSLDLGAIHNHRSNNCAHEVELGLHVMKLTLEALSFNKGQGTIPFVKMRQ